MSDIQKEIKEALNKLKGKWEYVAEINEYNKSAPIGFGFVYIREADGSKTVISDAIKSLDNLLFIANAPTWTLHLLELIEQKEKSLREQFEINMKLAVRLEQKDAEIARLTEQRNRTLAEWGKTLDDAEIIAAQLEKEESM